MIKTNILMSAAKITISNRLFVHPINNMTTSLNFKNNYYDFFTAETVKKLSMDEKKAWNE